MIYDYQHNEIKKRWLIIIALLINLAMLLFIFVLEMDTDWLKFEKKQERETEAPVVFDQMAPQPEPQQKLELESDEIAALKPRASVFGATDEVQDEAEFMPGTTDSETKFEEGAGEQGDEALEEHMEQEQLLKQESRLLDESPQTEAEKVEEESNEATDQADQKGLDRQEKEAIQKLEEGLTTLQTKLEKAQRKVEQEKATAVAAMKKAKATKHNTGSGKKMAAPIKREMTFADLAQGFIESFKNEGNDWFERAGNENIRPQQKELKYLSYFQKLAWHLQNVCRYHKFDFNPQRHNTNMETELLLTINKQGQMTNVKISRGSGSDEYDYFALRIFQSPYEYPPIPQHIPEETLTLPFLLICRAERQRLRFSFQ